MPALIATTLLNPGGTFSWPHVLSPQATTVPSLLTAKLLLSAAVIVIAFVRSGGTFVWPYVLSPQATMVPSLRSTMLLLPPVAIAMALVRPGGTLSWPPELSPQAATLSLSMILTVATEGAPIDAPPLTLERLMLNVLSPSARLLS